MLNQYPRPVVLTYGHSTQALAEFIELLAAHSVTRLIDVRVAPRSCYNLQFNRDTFPAMLEATGIQYEHETGIGGLPPCRSAVPESELTKRFISQLRRLHADRRICAEQGVPYETRKQKRVAIMWAGAVPWRCHRSLIADAPVVRSVRAEEDISTTRLQAHTLTAFAKADGTTITYLPQKPPFQK